MSAVPPGAVPTGPVSPFSAAGLTDIGTAAGGLFTGIGDLMQGFATAAADRTQAQIYGEEADYLTFDQGVQEQTDFLKMMAEQRKAGQVIGAGQAAAAANGLKESGSVLSLLRESVMEGSYATANQLVQANLNFTNYAGQIAAVNLEQQAASQAASNAQMGGIFGFLGGVAKAGFALAPLIV